MQTSGLQGATPAPVAFRLVPYPGDPTPTDLTVGGSASREAERLRVHYRLEGALRPWLIPPLSEAPQRRDELWMGTCLECFLALPDGEGYWEVNLSPAGHWNVYRLDGYRRGLRPEPSVTEAPAAGCLLAAGRFELTLDLPLPPPLAQAPALEVAVTAVIARRDGGLTYWALHHPAPQADFHHRGGFTLHL